MITGGCLCGGVRYEASGEPLYAGHCHCRDCQRATGAGHSSFMGFAASAVRISGETSAFAVVGDSGLPSVRRFCTVCGSQIFGEGDVTPGMLTVYAGTLDDPARFVPQMVIYAQSRPDWDRLVTDLPQFEAAPPFGED